MPRTLTRVGLHKLLWSRSAVQVAAEFGISSVALAKIAKKMAVPVPPRGHWARIAAGQVIPTPPLPPAPPLARLRYTIAGTAPAAPRPPSPEELARARAAEEERAQRVLTHRELLADSQRSLASLRRIAELRDLADLVEQRTADQPDDTRERAWLRWARETIRRAEERVVRGVGRVPTE